MFASDFEPDWQLCKATMVDIEVVNVFTSASGGGNPAPIVLSAGGMSEADMQKIARDYGHESGFVLPPDDPMTHDYRLRFFVPRHEMSMCGHATLGAVWLLAKHGLVNSEDLSIQTLSGAVKASIKTKSDGERSIEISQPSAKVNQIPFPELRKEILAAMGLTVGDALDHPILNSCTSRVKTLVPLRSQAALDAAVPDSVAIEALCERIGSTGFYPFAIDLQQARKFDARQFPKSSGYPEDAATGIAATALVFGLLHYGMVATTPEAILVHQGRAMGKPSDIHVRFDFADGLYSKPIGCFLGGEVELEKNFQRVDSHG